MKYSEKWGDSIDIAVGLALSDLNLHRDQVEVIVLEEPSKGFFGIGSKLAKVRVEEKTEVKTEVKTEMKQEIKPERKPETIKTEIKQNIKKQEKEEKKEIRKPEIRKEGNKEIVIEVCGLDESELSKPPVTRNRKKTARSGERRHKEPSRTNYISKPINEKPEDLKKCDDHQAGIFLSEVIKEMNLDVALEVFSNKESVYLDIEGKDTGTIIGKRGQTLDALQYLTSIVINKDKEDYVRVVVDAEGYRSKREATLENLANRLADKAVKSRRNVKLEPMNPYERKVIHTALQNRPEVTTKSEGEEPYRRVIIEPSK